MTPHLWGTCFCEVSKKAEDVGGTHFKNRPDLLCRCQTARSLLLQLILVLSLRCLHWLSIMRMIGSQCSSSSMMSATVLSRYLRQESASLTDWCDSVFFSSQGKKTMAVVTGGNLSAERHGNEILQPVAVLSLVWDLTPQDDNARLYRTVCIPGTTSRMEWP